MNEAIEVLADQVVEELEIEVSVLRVQSLCKGKVSVGN